MILVLQKKSDLVMAGNEKRSGVGKGVFIWWLVWKNKKTNMFFMNV